MNRLIRILLRDKDTILLPMMLVAMTVSFLPFLTGEFKGLEGNKESILLTLVTVGAVMALVMVRFLSGSNLSSAKDEMYRFELEHLRHELKMRIAKQISPVSDER